MSNIRAMGQASAFGDDEVAFSWMPLTHDMGLVGFHLAVLAFGFDHHIMRTDLFARRPLAWLKRLDQSGASLTCSPNFGYRHVLRMLEKRGVPAIDLSRIRLIYNGAEPIAPALAREFLERLAGTGLRSSTMFCVYGLAEASLAVSMPVPGAGMNTVFVARDSLGLGQRVRTRPEAFPGASELARLGRAVAECEYQIVCNDDGEPAPEGQVGRIEIRGKNVSAGYFEPGGAIAANGLNWRDTGDLGFVHEGELVVTGRTREIIFVHGQNIYPQDIESELMERFEALADRQVAAASARPERAEADQLLIFIRHRGPLVEFAELARKVAHRLNRDMGLSGALVIPVHTIPRTTSGKLQRGALAKAWLDGEFSEALAELKALLEAAPTQGATGSGQMVRELKRICDEILPEKEIGPEDNLFERDLSSLDLAQLFEMIESRFPGRLEVTDLFDFPTIVELAEYLERSD